MSGGIGVFSSESGSESVNIAHRAGVVFSWQLATDSQESRLFEEIFCVIDHFCSLILRYFCDRLLLFRENSGDLEHGSCALTVTGGYQRSAYVYEPSVLVEQVRCQEDWVPHTHNRSDQISAWTQMGNFTEGFRFVVLFSQRVRFLVAFSEYFHEVQFVFVT